MNHLNLRTTFITVVALGAAQASLASGCRWPCDPPFGRNGWQPAETAKAMPQSAAAQTPAGATFQLRTAKINAQAATTTPAPAVKATAQGLLRTTSDR